MWEAMCGLADIYLECGWDVNAAEQTAFHSIEFTEKRSKNMSEIVEPLEEDASREGEVRCSSSSSFIKAPDIHEL